GVSHNYIIRAVATVSDNPVDAGTPEIDAGTPEVDAGAPEDAGSDAGIEPLDAGTTPVDAGTTVVDAGAPEDAGSPPPDAGMPEDAVPPPPDAGSPIQADGLPILTGITPDIITSGDVTPVVIQGFNFIPETKFKVGNVVLLQATVTASNLVNATVPATLNPGT